MAAAEMTTRAHVRSQVAEHAGMPLTIDERRCGRRVRDVTDVDANTWVVELVRNELVRLADVGQHDLRHWLQMPIWTGERTLAEDQAGDALPEEATAACGRCGTVCVRLMWMVSACMPVCRCTYSSVSIRGKCSQG